MKVLLSHGAGGKKSWELIKELASVAGDSELLNFEDAALVGGFSNLLISTDSFTVFPLFFPGGDIGKLAACGTLNDIAVRGGRPVYLAVSIIIEEGFALEELRKIWNSLCTELSKAGVRLVAADTKVVEKGKGDGVYVTTTGIGELVYAGIGIKNARPGDLVFVSGPVGEHGAAIASLRFGIKGDFESDCSYVGDELLPVFEKAPAGVIHSLRDPTRGGLATVLNEIAFASGVEIEIFEEQIPVSERVKNLCETLGLDPLYLACEGRFVAVFDPRYASVFENLENGKIIGEVREGSPRLILKTVTGGRRVLRMLSGELLPRIC